MGCVVLVQYACWHNNLYVMGRGAIDGMKDGSIDCAYLFRRILSVALLLVEGLEGAGDVREARVCLWFGDPGSGVAEFKVNSGYFRTHGKRENRCA